MVRAVCVPHTPPPPPHHHPHTPIRHHHSSLVHIHPHSLYPNSCCPSRFGRSPLGCRVSLASSPPLRCDRRPIVKVCLVFGLVGPPSSGAPHPPGCALGRRQSSWQGLVPGARPFAGSYTGLCVSYVYRRDSALSSKSSGVSGHSPFRPRCRSRGLSATSLSPMCSAYVGVISLWCAGVASGTGPGDCVQQPEAFAGSLLYLAYLASPFTPPAQMWSVPFPPPPRQAFTPHPLPLPPPHLPRCGPYPPPPQPARLGPLVGLRLPFRVATFSVGIDG